MVEFLFIFFKDISLFNGSLKQLIKWTGVDTYAGLVLICIYSKLLQFFKAIL